MQKICAVVLCAGDGKRMKSEKPKVMCEVLFKPMVNWICDALCEMGINDICLVCSDKSDLVQKAVPQAEVVLQTERRGTGHAVMQAKEFLSRYSGGDCVVLCGDAPFMSAEVIGGAYAQHKTAGCAMTVITAELCEPFGYGRIVRDSQTGFVSGIVEQADTDSATSPIKEVNSGGYIFKTDFLIEAIAHLTTNNKQNEYYLTEAVSYAVKNGLAVGGYKAAQADVILGANDRAQLLHLNEVARLRNIKKALESGVELLSTDGVIITDKAEIGHDTRILPNTILRGKIKIGKGCVIGPNTVLSNVTVGDNTVINASQATEAVIGSGVNIGPFAYIRPNCTIADGVKVGDFVELKNSNIGEKTSIAHLTYIGDSDIAGGVNMGGGIITCNYDGKNKYRTVIEANSFVGCNTNLVAPVKVGEGAYIAAGSTITEDVPKNALSVARARQVNKEGWNDKRHK
ncbi:MAG: bifunctional UDP-N-acetylglucosamine diphosphorylase/glucosamine-1-phosphate N-acetyltransferase GlmU [Hydrogenoanaerobacterium sp.]